jgi:hypothetical protein
MTNIPANQGAIKQSELFTDNPQPLLNIQTGDDGMTLVEQLRRVASDALRRLGLVLTSRDLGAFTPGDITWSGTAIQFPPSTSIVLKLLQSEASQTTGGVPVDLIMTYGGSNTPTAFSSITLNNGDIVYVEIERELIPTSPSTTVGGITSVQVPLYNAAGGGSINNGLTVKVAQTLPALAAPQGAVQGTICIPIAIRVDSALWWIPHGIFWPAGTSSPLGAVVTSTIAPVKSIIEYHSMGAQDPYGYNSTKVVAPGYQLCDGTLIIEPLSAFKNPTRNNDGTPGPSFNASLDVFTPQIIGVPGPYADGGFGVSLINYAAGDYVTYYGARYVAVQSVSSGNVIQAVPAFWISGQAYVTGNLVIDNLDFNGYQCTSNVTGTTHPSADPTHWSLLAAPFWVSETIYNDVTTNDGAGHINPYSKYRRLTINLVNSFTRGNYKTFLPSLPGGYGGAATSSVSLLLANLPAHNHVINISDPGHVHYSGYTRRGSDQGGFTYDYLANQVGAGVSGTEQVGANPAVGTSTTGITASSNNTGSGTPFSVATVPPYANVLKMIRIY